MKARVSKQPPRRRDSPAYYKRDAAWYRRTFHVAWGQLAHLAGMSKEDYEPIYREILRQCGATDGPNGPSLGSMTAAQKEAALAQFKQRGFDLKNGGKGGFKAPANGDSLLVKAYGLWRALAGFGIVQNDSRAAFEAWALKRIRGDKLEWSTAPEREQLVEALKLWAKRKGCEIRYDALQDSWIEHHGEVA
ncbi:MAG TPA: hypothetical protein DIC36_03360 [Gammaproteobacteria bacterium]|nr:hypothetical protein [Gammaproteobacteria bacterium]